MNDIKELKNRIKTFENHEFEFKKLLLKIFGIKVISEDEAKKIIDAHKPYGNFLVVRNNLYKAIDNTNGDILTAEFLSLEKAFTFLKTEIFVEVLKNDKATS